MKRSYPPDAGESTDSQNAEREIIERRLEELFLSSKIRNPLITSKATYLEHAHHSRLDSVTNQPDGLTYYSRENNYHYLDSYQALYLLESRQISIYYNELPLSIAEAYNLLIRSPTELKNYVVFALLNRRGFFCRTHRSGMLSLARMASSESRKVEGSSSDAPRSTLIGPTRPLLCDNERIVGEPQGDLMSRILRHGPQDCHSLSIGAQDLDALISFDAYKRETYKLTKPKVDGGGEPDYYVIIQDKNKVLKFPNDHTLCSSDETVLDKCLFAIVDEDSSINFVLCGASRFPSDMRD